MFQDHLESALGTDTVVEGDLDDRSQLFVVVVRSIAANGGRHGLGLGDDAVVCPGRRDVAGIEVPGTHLPDRGDVFFFVLGALWFGNTGERALEITSGRPSSSRALSKSASSKARFSPAAARCSVKRPIAAEGPPSRSAASTDVKGVRASCVSQTAVSVSAGASVMARAVPHLGE